MSIFVINPGSTSTKLALFEDGKEVVSRELRHAKGYLAQFERVVDQLDFRRTEIHEFMVEASIDTGSIVAVVGRGGLLHPMKGGVYEVSDDMVDDLKKARYGEHPCNLGAILAHELAGKWSVPAFIVDPVATDEMMDIARLTGLPSIERRSLFHALNQRSAAKSVAARLGCDYEVSNFIVCHMGGGISIGAHRQGMVVDVVNALDGEGPFSPERTGGLPILQVLEVLERGDKTPEELKQAVLREGGVFAFLGTNDMRELVKRMESGDKKARLVFKSLAYNISKSIMSLIPALIDENGCFSLSAIILTGGVAYSEPLVNEIKKLVGSVGLVEVVVGEREMTALAAGADEALKGIVSIGNYLSEA